MAKYCGNIGFRCTEEKRPGVHMPSIVELPYTGDLLENIRRWEQSDQVNDNFNVENKISILADEYAYRNAYNIAYVTLLGGKWKVRSIDVSYPRLILSIGGVYHDGDDCECSGTEEA